MAEENDAKPRVEVLIQKDRVFDSEGREHRAGQTVELLEADAKAFQEKGLGQTVLRAPRPATGDRRTGEPAKDPGNRPFDAQDDAQVTAASQGDPPSGSDPARGEPVSGKQGHAPAPRSKPGR